MMGSNIFVSNVANYLNIEEYVYENIHMNLKESYFSDYYIINTSRLNNLISRIAN